MFEHKVKAGAAEVNSVAKPGGSHAPLVWLLVHFVLGCLGAVIARYLANQKGAGSSMEELFPSLWESALSMWPGFAAGSVFFLLSHFVVHRHFRDLTSRQRDAIWLPCIVAAIGGLSISALMIWLGGRV